MTERHKRESVLFFASPDDIDLGNAADRFVELAAALGADPDSAQMVGPLDLLIQGEALQITLSICDEPLATEDFLAAKRPENGALDEDEVFTAVALHEAAIVLRVTGAPDGIEAALSQLTACVIGRMPVAAVYCVENRMLMGSCEYLDTHAGNAPVRPRRVCAKGGIRSARPGNGEMRRPHRSVAQLPDLAASEHALAVALEEAVADKASADLRADWAEHEDMPPAGFITRLAGVASSLPLVRIFSHREALH